MPRWPVVPRPAAGKVFVPSLLLLVLLPPSFVFPGPGFDAPSRWRNPFKVKPVNRDEIIMTVVSVCMQLKHHV